MDFCRLPEKVILQIIEELPFVEKVRIGRVDTFFLRISNVSISRTKHLSGEIFGVNRLRKITPDSFSLILQLCSENLETFEFNEERLVETFAQFSFPRLIELYLGKIDFGNIGNDLFDVIMSNNPNIEKLSFTGRSYFSATGSIYEKLKALDITTIDRQQLSRLIGRCPNLVHFFGIVDSDNDENFDDIWNDFFEQCTMLETVIFMGTCVDFYEMESFWRLSTIRSLDLHVDPNPSYSSDDFLTKIATSFPHLTELQLGGVCPTNRGFGALAALQSLHTIMFYCRTAGDLNGSVIQLAQGRRLQRFQISCSITPVTFVTLVSKCSNLEGLGINDIQDVDTPEAAAELVKSLSRYHDSGERMLRIEFLSKNSNHTNIWESDEVASAVKELKQSKKFELVFRL